MQVIMENSQKPIAIYALSADPITFGHINIIERAAACFEKIIVAIGVNPTKSYLFNLEERLKLAEASTKHLLNIEVTSFSGLLVDFAYEQNAKVIIKGVRNSNDFDYESTLHQVGDSQHLGIDTHLLFSDNRYEHISSSAVKGLQFEQGFIHELVPLPVKVALEKKLSDQIIIGVTGSIASGKSTLCELLAKKGKEKDLPIYNIDMDALSHELLDNDSSPYAQNLRKKIIECFGEGILESGQISRKQLGNIVFKSPEKLNQLNQMMAQPLLLKLRKSIYQKRGLILLNAALLSESGMLALCNNRIVLIEVDEKEQFTRLKNRGYSHDHARKRLSSQFDTKRKAQLIQSQINHDGFGKLWCLNSSAPFDADDILNTLMTELGNLGGDQ